MRHEEELRERFRAMRREEIRAAPPFSAPAATPRSFPVSRLAAAAALAIIAIAGAWWLIHEPRGQDLAFLQLDRTEWVGSTDFLLDIGDRTLLGTVPAIGGPRPRGAGAPANQDLWDTAGIERRRS